METRLTNLLDDPVIQGILSIARDVTDREEALARLRESEERFRTLVEGAFDAILVVDEEGRIGYMSPAAERILGRPVEERLGASAFETLHPDDDARARTGLETVLADPEATAREELRVRHADGGWTTLEVVARNFLDHPAVQGVVVNLRDITERRELESRLLQAQKMEAVGRLAGGVAHDFNNLLTAIGGTADLLLEDLPDAAGQRDDIATIRHMADRASQLTRQLLAFSRQQILQPQLLDLADQVRRTESMLQRLLREDAEVALDLPDAPVPILLDPLQVEQILVNLAVNARDAMPEGGRLTLGVDTRTGPGGDEAVLTVEDTGHGMSPETLARAFEPFFTTKPTGEGTGLGLATVYGIVEQSGGSVEAESEPGEGTRVVGRFPRAPPNGLESPPSPAPPETEPGEGVVLVVEDEDSVRHLLERILARAGYTVLSASHGPGALELSDARDGPIDVLVTDVVMPGMNGIEVAAELTDRRPSLQVLYISGYASEEHELTRRVEEDRFLPKPFTPQELLDAVRGLVAARGRITPR
jgi:PAS domain S-box-containing protein